MTDAPLLAGAALEATPPGLRLLSAAGLVVLLAGAWAFSSARGHVNGRLVFWGLSLQGIFALVIFQPLWMGLLGAFAALGLDAAWSLWRARRTGEGLPLAGRRLRTRGLAWLVTGAALALVGLLPDGTWPATTGPWAGLHDALFGAPVGRRAFGVLSAVVNRLLGFTDVGTGFLVTSQVTGEWSPALKNLLFAVLPTIIFFSSLMTVLYHLGAMQTVVRAMAWLMQRTMGTSGAESMSAAANIFVGQTEAPLVVKPFVPDMTRSELMAIMTGGFATVAGGVLAAYVAMLSGYFPGIAGHLIAASIMNAPAGLVFAKLLVPEVQVPRTRGGVDIDVERPDANVIGAAARGAGEGMQLYLNVVAMLLAFLALIAMGNWLLGLYGQSFATWTDFTWMVLITSCVTAVYVVASRKPVPRRRRAAAAVGAFLLLSLVVRLALGPQALTLTLEGIVGTLLSPIALLMGIPWADAPAIGHLLGEKIILNEFIAYTDLAQMMRDATTAVSPRAFTIATYALLGFANLGSIAIQIGGIGGIAPTRKADLARLGPRAMIAGTLAAWSSACIAGILL